VLFRGGCVQRRLEGWRVLVAGRSGVGRLGGEIGGGGGGGKAERARWVCRGRKSAARRGRGQEEAEEEVVELAWCCMGA